jgi:hypothetical protein
MKYKGIEYELKSVDGDRWTWIFFPRTEGEPQVGEVTGIREHAEMACMTAINRWLTASIETVAPFRTAIP